MSAETPLTHLEVDVTFLEMTAPPVRERAIMPPGLRTEHDVRLGLEEYRTLYTGVGREWCWWMRLVLPDHDLSRILERPTTHITLLREGAAVRGFYELDQIHARRSVNIAYFGLLPGALGRGAGRQFLRTAIDEAWSLGAERVTVNTCTADHPRALPLYLSEGFSVIRVVRESWDIPAVFSLRRPAHLT
ncbi:GNAT family N-acetyltransferase [Acetobacter sp. AN02]|uniref:GNAT family N-acetyltransferase n=1 Tax=Acetobacter sp. AN02 TaxID=2894186 RepID=UPI0024342889|nr:GNAT family N-acetyltransferase [Acetobacter sp. AN02]MDG6094347.1 GNAT family N-acetyltransferase [Acetobacter sp. AN02]